MNKQSKLLFLLLILLISAGCGGGGGSSTPTIPPDPPPPEEPASNANLAGIMTSSGVLDQIFQVDQLEYTVSVGYLTRAIRVFLTLEDTNATVTIDGSPLKADSYSQFIPLSEAVNPAIEMTVTAEDGTTTKTYRLVVTRASASSFAQAAYIKATNTEFNDQFGASLVIWGDTLAIAAPNEQSSATGADGDELDNSLIRAGAVYVFHRSAGVWSAQAYLKASNTEREDRFGESLALWGNTLVVGAPGEDGGSVGVNGDDADNSELDSGAVYVFVRSGSSWSQQAYIKPSNPGAGDAFGSAIAIERDTLVVGAPLEQSGATGINGDESSNAKDRSGAVYVFNRVNDLWNQEAYIKASNSEFNDRFGAQLDMSGDRLIVGATGEDGGIAGVNGNDGDNSQADSGAAYVFSRTGGNWVQEAYLKSSNVEAADGFGSSLAIAGDLLVIGAPFEDSLGSESDNSAANSGAVYVFEVSGKSWNQVHYLKSPLIESSDSFGAQVALSGFTLAVSSSEEDSASIGLNADQTDNTLLSSGAAWVYHFDGLASWSLIGYIKASNTEFQDVFGASLAFQGDTLVIGAPLEDSAARGVDGDQSDNTVSDSGAGYIWQ